jgi:citrate synthase
MVNEPALLSAREATRLLGVKIATLYAYVSRGLVRSVPDQGSRARRYYRGDLELLKARHDARAGHGALASAALRWGEPVLDSAITSIGEEGPRYRGQLAIELAEQGRSLEEVAELLWTSALPKAVPSWRADGLGCSTRIAALVPHDAPKLAILSLLVPALAIRDADRFGAPVEGEHARARSLVLRMAASLSLPGRAARTERALSESSVSAAVGQALGARRSKETIAAIDRALVVCADHELNASTFAARVTASTGADLYACVSSALAALSGPLHGGTSERVESLVAEVGNPQRATTVIHERTRRGERVPGFGHRLYPRRDPRATVLLDTARALAPKSEVVRVVLALIRAMRDAGHEPPTVDIGLVAIAGALGLPSGSAVALFAIGRATGWIAHALEQRAAGFLLRPRARYIGP